MRLSNYLLLLGASLVVVSKGTAPKAAKKEEGVDAGYKYFSVLFDGDRYMDVAKLEEWREALKTVTSECPLDACADMTELLAAFWKCPIVSIDAKVLEKAKEVCKSDSNIQERLQAAIDFDQKFTGNTLEEKVKAAGKVNPLTLNEKDLDLLIERSAYLINQVEAEEIEAITKSAIDAHEIRKQLKLVCPSVTIDGYVHGRCDLEQLKASNIRQLASLYQLLKDHSKRTFTNPTETPSQPKPDSQLISTLMTRVERAIREQVNNLIKGTEELIQEAEKTKSERKDQYSRDDLTKIAGTIDDLKRRKLLLNEIVEGLGGDHYLRLGSTLIDIEGMKKEVTEKLSYVRRIKTFEVKREHDELLEKANDLLNEYRKMGNDTRITKFIEIIGKVNEVRNQIENYQSYGHFIDLGTRQEIIIKFGEPLEKMGKLNEELVTRCNSRMAEIKGQLKLGVAKSKALESSLEDLKAMKKVYDEVSVGNLELEAMEFQGNANKLLKAFNQACSSKIGFDDVIGVDAPRCEGLEQATWKSLNSLTKELKLFKDKPDGWKAFEKTVRERKVSLMLITIAPDCGLQALNIQDALAKIMHPICIISSFALKELRESTTLIMEELKNLTVYDAQREKLDKKIQNVIDLMQLPKQMEEPKVEISAKSLKKAMKIPDKKTLAEITNRIKELFDGDQLYSADALTKLKAAIREAYSSENRDEVNRLINKNLKAKQLDQRFLGALGELLKKIDQNAQVTDSIINMQFKAHQLTKHDISLLKPMFIALRNLLKDKKPVHFPQAAQGEQSVFDLQIIVKKAISTKYGNELGKILERSKEADEKMASLPTDPNALFTLEQLTTLNGIIDRMKQVKEHLSMIRMEYFPCLPKKDWQHAENLENELNRHLSQYSAKLSAAQRVVNDHVAHEVKSKEEGVEAIKVKFSIYSTILELISYHEETVDSGKPLRDLKKYGDFLEGPVAQSLHTTLENIVALSSELADQIADMCKPSMGEIEDGLALGKATVETLSKATGDLNTMADYCETRETREKVEAFTSRVKTLREAVGKVCPPIKGQGEFLSSSHPSGLCTEKQLYDAELAQLWDISSAFLSFGKAMTKDWEDFSRMVESTYTLDSKLLSEVTAKVNGLCKTNVIEDAKFIEKCSFKDKQIESLMDLHRSMTNLLKGKNRKHIEESESLFYLWHQVQQARNAKLKERLELVKKPLEEVCGARLTILTIKGECKLDGQDVDKVIKLYDALVKYMEPLVYADFPVDQGETLFDFKFRLLRNISPKLDGMVNTIMQWLKASEPIFTDGMSPVIHAIEELKYLKEFQADLIEMKDKYDQYMYIGDAVSGLLEIMVQNESAMSEKIKELTKEYVAKIQPATEYQKVRGQLQEIKKRVSEIKSEGLLQLVDPETISTLDKLVDQASEKLRKVRAKLVKKLQELEDRWQNEENKRDKLRDAISTALISSIHLNYEQQWLNLTKGMMQCELHGQVDGYLIGMMDPKCVITSFDKNDLNELFELTEIVRISRLSLCTEEEKTKWGIVNEMIVHRLEGVKDSSNYHRVDSVNEGDITHLKLNGLLVLHDVVLNRMGQKRVIDNIKKHLEKLKTALIEKANLKLQGTINKYSAERDGLREKLKKQKDVASLVRWMEEMGSLEVNVKSLRFRTSAELQRDLQTLAIDLEGLKDEAKQHMAELCQAAFKRIEEAIKENGLEGIQKTRLLLKDMKGHCDADMINQFLKQISEANPSRRTQSEELKSTVTKTTFDKSKRSRSAAKTRKDSQAKEEAVLDTEYSSYRPLTQPPSRVASSEPGDHPTSRSSMETSERGSKTMESRLVATSSTPHSPSGTSSGVATPSSQPQSQTPRPVVPTGSAATTAAALTSNPISLTTEQQQQQAGSTKGIPSGSPSSTMQPFSASQPQGPAQQPAAHPSSTTTTTTTTSSVPPPGAGLSSGASSATPNPLAVVGGVGGSQPQGPPSSTPLGQPLFSGNSTPTSSAMVYSTFNPTITSHGAFSSTNPGQEQRQEQLRQEQQRQEQLRQEQQRQEQLRQEQLRQEQQRRQEQQKTNLADQVQALETEQRNFNGKLDKLKKQNAQTDLSQIQTTNGDLQSRITAIYNKLQAINTAIVNAQTQLSLTQVSDGLPAIRTLQDQLSRTMLTAQDRNIGDLNNRIEKLNAKHLYELLQRYWEINRAIKNVTENLFGRTDGQQLGSNMAAALSKKYWEVYEKLKEESKALPERYETRDSADQTLTERVFKYKELQGDATLAVHFDGALNYWHFATENVTTEQKKLILDVKQWLKGDINDEEMINMMKSITYELVKPKQVAQAQQPQQRQQSLGSYQGQPFQVIQ